MNFRTDVVGVQIDMEDEIVVTAYAVPEGATTESPNLDYPVVRLGAASGDVVFLGPDGSTIATIAENERSNAKVKDSDINDPMNEAWSGSKDSTFMAAVQQTMAGQVQLLSTAASLARASGKDVRQLIHLLSRQAAGDGEKVFVADAGEAFTEAQ